MILVNMNSDTVEKKCRNGLCHLRDLLYKENEYFIFLLIFHVRYEEKTFLYVH